MPAPSSLIPASPATVEKQDARSRRSGRPSVPVKHCYNERPEVSEVAARMVYTIRGSDVAARHDAVACSAAVFPKMAPVINHESCRRFRSWYRQVIGEKG
jgi:hypothetical protein